jgi:DNA-binding MarR family transcriptional regulator
MSHTKPAPAVSAAQIADQLVALNSALDVQPMGGMLQILREADLSLPRLVALIYLHKSGAASISAISEHLNLALGTTSHVVDQLVQSGYVERREAESDRRHKEVRLTERGLDLVGRVRRQRLDEAAQRLDSLSPDLLLRLHDTLRAVLAQLGRSADH